MGRRDRLCATGRRTFQFHGSPQGDWDGVIFSEVLALEPGRRLAFTWAVPNLPATTVEFSLREIEGGTEVTIAHSGFDQFGPEILPIRDQLDGGWGGAVLPQLKALAEAG